MKNKPNTKSSEKFSLADLRNSAKDVATIFEMKGLVAEAETFRN